MPTLDAAAVAVASWPRRCVVERLADGPKSVSVLAEHLGISVPATLKHLARLEEGGLVSRHKQGRVVTITLIPGGLEPLAEWATRTQLF